MGQKRRHRGRRSPREVVRLEEGIGGMPDKDQRHQVTCSTRGWRHSRGSVRVSRGNSSADTLTMAFRLPELQFVVIGYGNPRKQIHHVPSTCLVNIPLGGRWMPLDSECQLVSKKSTKQ